MSEIEPVADFVSFDDEGECMQQDADSLSGILNQVCESTEQSGDDDDENAELSFTSVTSEAPDDLLSGSGFESGCEFGLGLGFGSGCGSWSKFGCEFRSGTG